MTLISFIVGMFQDPPRPIIARRSTTTISKAVDSTESAKAAISAKLNSKARIGHLVLLDDLESDLRANRPYHGSYQFLCLAVKQSVLVDNFVNAVMTELEERSFE